MWNRSHHWPSTYKTASLKSRRHLTCYGLSGKGCPKRAEETPLRSSTKQTTHACQHHSRRLRASRKRVIDFRASRSFADKAFAAAVERLQRQRGG